MRKPRNECKLKQKIRTFFLTHPLTVYKTVNGDILTNDSVKVLMCCIYDVNDMVYFDNDIRTHFLDAYLENKMTHFEIFNALQYLERIGLIENLEGTKDNYTFRVTHEGINFLELRRKNTFYLLTNSVLVPIIVSVITSVITFLCSEALLTWLR